MLTYPDIEKGIQKDQYLNIVLDVAQERRSGTSRRAWLFHRVDQEDNGCIYEKQWIRHAMDMHEQIGHHALERFIKRIITRCEKSPAGRWYQCLCPGGEAAASKGETPSDAPKHGKEEGPEALQKRGLFTAELSKIYQVHLSNANVNHNINHNGNANTGTRLGLACPGEGGLWGGPRGKSEGRCQGGGHTYPDPNPNLN